jgi:uncharacterized membrane protein
LIKNLSLKKNGLPKKQKDKRRETENEWGNPSSSWAYLVILLVLIPYFFCVTGVTSQMFGVRNGIILNLEGEHYDSWYVHDQESYSAKWLRDNGELENTKIYTGRGIGGRLTSQAGIRQYDSRSLFAEGRKIDGYIYLRYYNVVDGKIIDAQKKEQNMTEYQDKFDGKSEIYNNGGSEIWR